MGYMRHNAIIVTSWNKELLGAAHAKAVEIFNSVAPITPPAVNGFVTFLVAPDGSKEGWEGSNAGDAARDELINWLNSTALDWAEIQFGDDGGSTEIIRHSDTDTKE